LNITMPKDPKFNQYYQKHVKLLKLSGFRPKTIYAYSRALRRIGNYFDCRIDNLLFDQLLEYFHDLLDEFSWSAVKLDLYGLRFFYTMVLKKIWKEIPLIKPPRTSRIPGILSIEEVNRLVDAKLSLSKNCKEKWVVHCKNVGSGEKAMKIIRTMISAPWPRQTTCCTQIN